MALPKTDKSFFVNSPYSSYRLDEIKRKIHYLPMDIMLFGATGAGKSSTLNALLGEESAKVGYGVDPETSAIQSYYLNEYVRLWDTPGLGDSPERDRRYLGMIGEKLKETYDGKNGEAFYLIDMALLLVDGSSRDLGTVEKTLNRAFRHISADRVQVVVNQADMAMKGRHWNGKKPDGTLQNFLNEQAVSLQRRISESTKSPITRPLFYSATNNFNLYSLMDFVIDNFSWEPRQL